jgi:hypothetical protein
MEPESHNSVHLSPSLQWILRQFNLIPTTFVLRFYILSHIPVFFSVNRHYLCCLQTPPFRKVTFRYEYFYVPIPFVLHGRSFHPSWIHPSSHFLDTNKIIASLISRHLTWTSLSAPLPFQILISATSSISSANVGACPCFSCIHSNGADMLLYLRATYSARATFLDLMILIISCAEYKLWRSSRLNFHPSFDYFLSCGSKYS